MATSSQAREAAMDHAPVAADMPFVATPQIPSTIEHPVDKIESPLLGLAAELRNHIYRYVLVEEDGNVRMPAALGVRALHHPIPPEPGLLATCRQIRSEAKLIYYSENTFLWNFADFDASLYIKWCQISPMHYNVRINCVAPCNPTKPRILWENIMLWLEKRHTKEVRVAAGGPHLQAPMHHIKRFVNCIANDARRLQDEDGLDWPAIRKSLEDRRKVAAIFAPLWDFEK